MVRSSGSHHRKRSRSRSLTPDHKRSKSSRDYDKERIRRRSRSRDRIRRSRSRDRKKDKKISESRVRSKPLKLKRRSRSRSKSRSKSKDKNPKKEEKKDTKAEDEPFDPTNLDKIPGDDEEWVVTDVIEEPSMDDNEHLEEEIDYEADEDDQYSHTSSHSHHISPYRSSTQENCSGNVESNKTEENLHSEHESDKQTTENEHQNNESADAMQILKADKNITKEVDNENVTSTVSSLKEMCSVHKEKLRMLSSKKELERLQSKNYSHSRSSDVLSENLKRLSKDQIRQAIQLEKELYKLRVKHEIARHNAELEVIKAQLQYWKKKH